MRILHTGDWHLGHTLRDLSREYEHRSFLRWLLDQLGANDIDVVLVAGDVFHTANPPASAQAAWYWFLGEAIARYPGLTIAVIAGNHDSPVRLEAARPVLGPLGVTVLGRPGRIDDMVVPLRARGGGIEGWLAAVPFLRRSDAPGPDGVRDVFRRVLAAARARMSPGQALLAMGHLQLAGAAVSPDSERIVPGAVPADVFPDDLAYVALGHLHLAQKVGRDEIRYAGSPLPLSMGEADYCHQVTVVDVEGARATAIRHLRVPRAVDLVRIPKRGRAVPADALAAIDKLGDAREALFADTRPYVEVRVLLDAPDPTLRQRVEQALSRKHARLVRLDVEASGTGESLADAVPNVELRDVRPEDVFRQAWERRFEGDPPDDLLTAFRELLDADAGAAPAGEEAA